MAWLASIYVITALISGGFAMFERGFWLGLAGALAPLLAIVGGGGITTPGATGRPKLATIVTGLVMLAVAILWVRSHDWQLDLFGLRVPGTVQALVGFAVGLGFGLTDKGERGRFTSWSSSVEPEA